MSVGRLLGMRYIGTFTRLANLVLASRSVCMLGFVVVGAFTVAGATMAGENLVGVPFEFSADDKVPSSELAEKISKSDALRTDVYLNSPMTRLEYMLTLIEAELNDPLTKRGVSGYLADGFEKAQDLRGVVNPAIKGLARYNERAGKVLIAYVVDDLGRPKRAMKETCDRLLKSTGFNFPFTPFGYLLHNTLLGVLSQKDYEAYTPVLLKLAEHFVLRVTLASQTEQGHVHHHFACQQEKDANVVYSKFSFRLD